jgi:hypothetical protein
MVRDAGREVAPFLSFDDDPYPSWSVKLLWVLDTTSIGIRIQLATGWYLNGTSTVRTR